jgi:lysophospholipase L1-like esterase
MRRVITILGLVSVLAWPVPAVAQSPAAPAQGAPAQPGTGPAPAQPGQGPVRGGGFRGRGGPPRPANQPSPRDDARHQGFVEIAKRGNIDLLFVGDSITDWWARQGLEVWTANFAGLNPANFGIAGDTTQGVLWRMQNGELDGFTAKLIVLMLGTNNVNRNPVDEIVDGNRLILEEFKKRQPQAKVLLLGVFPRTAQADNPIRAIIKEMNEKLAKLADDRQVFFKDIGQAFLAPDGTLPADVMPDGLHPSARGYQIWADAIREDVTRLMR